MLLRKASFFACIGLLAGQDAPTSLLRQAQSDIAAGRYAAVVKEGAEASALFRKIGDRASEESALTVVGLAQLYSGDYPSALQRFTIALDLARQTRHVELEITLLNNIGTVFYYQGRYADAMDWYQQALRRVDASPSEKWTASKRQLTEANIAILYQTLGQFERALTLYSGLLHSRQALPPVEQAQLLANVGALRRRLGDPAKALDTYRAAQSLYKQAAHRDGEIAVLNNIGIVQAMDLRDFSGAIASFGSALRLAQQSGDRPLAVHARLYRGEALYRAGRLPPSAADFQAAWDEANALGELEESWKALYGLARIAADAGNIARANQLLARSVERIESLRAGLGGASLRSDFLADKRDVYDLLIEHASSVDDAFRFMEQSRARNLRDLARPSRPKTLSAFARGLPADTVVLEYWLGSSSAAVLWITASETGIKRWKLSAGEREEIAALPSILADAQRRNWREAARPIAQKLLSGIPVLGRPEIRGITIIPDGALAALPFESLPLGQSGLLIERFRVSYSPSAALLVEAATRRGVRWPWQKTLEAFADPSPGPGLHGVELAASRAWQRLPEASREVNGIAQILGGRSMVHIGPQARKQLLEDSPRAPVLHFATHAFVDMQDPDRSYILLAPASPSQRFDYLFLKEIYGLRLTGVDLTTVSACQTEVGKLVRGEGVESFSRAFLAAGSRSVVTSLWSVGDQVTAEVMLRFYSRLAAGAGTADALRAAKLDFLHYAPSSHPAYWAAFVLNGDSNSRLPYVIPWTWLGAPLVLLICAVVMIRTRVRKG